MHAALFGLKRSYWGSLKPMRKRLKDMGLTAARFDLLYVLSQRRIAVPQSALRRALGVTAPVVSRMLKALGNLGHVERKPDPFDRRGHLVSLTVGGRFKIREAIAEFIRSGDIDVAVEEGLCPGMPPTLRRQHEAFVRMHRLETLLDWLRDGFDAGGTLYYPWHPDD
jgi:DNA-binding MarR family transcriptional regulator